MNEASREWKRVNQIEACNNVPGVNGHAKNKTRERTSLNEKAKHF